MENHKTSEDVVEKRVARSVIRRRRQPNELDAAPEPQTKEAEPVQVPTVEPVLPELPVVPALKVEPVKPAPQESVPSEITVLRKPRVVGQIDLHPKPIVKQAPVAVVEAPLVSPADAAEAQKSLASAVAKAKAFEDEQKELRKNLTFKERLQGTISLDKLRMGRSGTLLKPGTPKPNDDSGTAVIANGDEDPSDESAQKTGSKVAKPAKHLKKVKDIGGDLDIEGGGKITTLTHLIRTNALDRVFRPESKMALRTKKKVLARKKTKTTLLTVKKATKRVIEADGTLTVAGFAQQLGVKATEIIKKLMNLGIMATINQDLDLDTITLIAQEYEYTIKDTSFKEEQILNTAKTLGVSEKAGLSRPPVVTIMGHVDHGKTSLLDAIRATSVTAQESGGITQHIGAYTVDLPQGKITFLDTPGHEAFTSMRARGAKVTDLVVLVVAADDGIMPQTEESIAHAKAANVPIIVAVNKMDKPDAKPDVVLRQLSEKGLLAEEWGGEVLVIKVSAVKKTGIKELLESILLQSEMLQLKANPENPAVGTVLEAKLDKGRGPVATFLVQDGTLKLGDALVAGDIAGRVRAMTNWKGERIDTAGPSTAVEVLGLDAMPLASDPFNVVATEQDAKAIAEHRLQLKKSENTQKAKSISLEDMFSQIKAGEVKEFNFILKTDVQGSLEAIEQAILKLGNEEVKPKIISSGVGAIRDSDINLAVASRAVLVGFHVRPETSAIHLAKEKGIEIKLYKIIYNLVDDLKLALSGMLAPTIKENYLGRAEVRNTFQVSKIGLVAGCMVVDGLINRHAKIRLLRDNVVIHEGEITSLKRFKDDAREVKQGFECGVGIGSFQDAKSGDVIEAFTLEEIKRSL